MTKPKNADIASIFDKVAESYEEISNPYTVKRRTDYFIKNAKGKCLEVGAGTGEVAKALKKEGFEITATDISKKMVKKIKKKGIKAGVCDAEKLPFPKNSFDTLIAAELIYYLDNPKNFISEARRVLKPKGLLLISSANQETRFYDRTRQALRKLGISDMYFDDPVHEFFSANKLEKLLKDAGFKNRKIEKIILFPFSSFDFLNRFLEKTPIKHLGVFLVSTSTKS